jgi:hypothetical protein
MNEPIKISIFPNAKKVDDPFYISIAKVVDRIKFGKSKDRIEYLRSLVDEKEQTEYKRKQLPVLCFSGIFSYRADAKLIKHSGLICVDFDHLNENLIPLKEKLLHDRFTFLLFISPRGNGLKLVVKIPPNILTHKRSCKALTQYYAPQEVDEYADLSRACFESYDPDIYYNPESEIFLNMSEPIIVENKKTEETVLSDFAPVLLKIERWLNKKDQYNDGNKHNYLVRLFSACLRFGIPEEDAVQLIIYKYQNQASYVKDNDFYEIAKRVYRNYSHTWNTAKFENDNPVDKENNEILVTDLDTELPLKDVIYQNDIKEDMLLSFRNGQARGETTHFPEIDEVFRWKRGELTIFHGLGNHGKSTMVMQLCLLKAIKDNYRFAFFSPEQDPPSDFYDELIHMMIGENTQPYYHNQMSEEVYKSTWEFINDHFFYIYPENDSPTQEYINDRFVSLIKKHHIDGCIIDPYNQLDNDIEKKSAGKVDQYLSSFLSKQKRFAQLYKQFMIIITHPRGDVTKTAGNYDKPDVYNLSGGAMWNNKSDNIINIHRPFFGTDKQCRIVHFTSQKIKKQKLCGIPGVVELEFQFLKMRYYSCPNLFNPLENNKIEGTKSEIQAEIKYTNRYEVDKEDLRINETLPPF